MALIFSMKYKYCFLFLIVASFSLSCKQITKEQKIESDSTKSDLVLVPQDTIKIKYSGHGTVLSDVRNNKLLLFDFFFKEILVTDLKGEILHKFDGTFLGSNSFGTDIFAVHFQSDTTLSVASNQGFQIYNFDGKLLKRYLHPFDLSSNRYLNGDYKLCYNDRHQFFITMLTTPTTAHVNQPQFYKEVKHLTVLDLKSGKYSFQVPYEPESSYLQTDYYNNMVAPYFDVWGDSLAVIYPRDPIVYLYSIPDFNKLTSFNTNPKVYRHEAKFKFEVKKDNKDQLLEFSNSKFFKIFIRHDTIFTSYTSGIPTEVFDGINDLETYNQVSYKYLTHYLQVFVNGKKIVKDFALPKEFPRVNLINASTVYLNEEARWHNRSDGMLRYLVCRLDLPN